MKFLLQLNLLYLDYLNVYKLDKDLNTTESDKTKCMNFLMRFADADHCDYQLVFEKVIPTYEIFNLTKRLSSNRFDIIEALYTHVRLYPDNRKCNNYYDYLRLLDVIKLEYAKLQRKKVNKLKILDKAYANLLAHTEVDDILKIEILRKELKDIKGKIRALEKLAIRSLFKRSE